MYRTRGDGTGSVSLVTDKFVAHYWQFFGQEFQTVFISLFTKCLNYLRFEESYFQHLL